jgi:hypothetical protein
MTQNMATYKRENEELKRFIQDYEASIKRNNLEYERTILDHENKFKMMGPEIERLNQALKLKVDELNAFNSNYSKIYSEY